jgi:predicted small lipoprotein YifL
MHRIPWIAACAALFLALAACGPSEPEQNPPVPPPPQPESTQ